MKNVLSLTMAGMLGGMIALSGSYFLQSPEQSPKELVKNEFAMQANNRFNATPVVANAPFDFTAAARKAMPVVVHIKASESEQLAKQRRQKERGNDPFFDFFGNPFGGGLRQGAGSGVIISNDGYIVTNNHVVEQADELEVTLYDNRQFKAKIIGTDETTDMAVIKIEATNLPTMPYADSDAAEVGQWVLAVGNPFDLTSTVTAGIISAKGRDIGIIPGRSAIESFIQTDAAVNPGNSGGALVNDKGELLGINTAIATQTGSFSGYSFAIPINMAKKIVEDIIEYGSYQRAFLGIEIQELDSDHVAEMGLPITKGVFVSNVIDGGSAQFAGLLPNDVITKVGNKKIESVPELQEAIGRSKIGDTVQITVSRKGKEKEIPVVLKKG
jgi:serine protease Do